MPGVVADLRLAFRGIRRNPLFAATAILSLALGIGANTAIFTLLDQIVLRKLPVKNPDELVMLWQDASNMGNNTGVRMHSYPLYQDLQQRAEPFSEVMCRRLTEASVSIDGSTERIGVELVSGNYFGMLGVRPALGRVFSSEQDDRIYNGHPVVVLSYDYWTRRFANDRSILGKPIRVNDYPMTIVGVSAEGFYGVDPAESPQLRVPVQMKPVLLPDWPWLRMDDRRSKWIQVFARLKPVYTVESAAAPVQGLYTQIRSYEMSLPVASTWSAYYREQFMKGRLVVEPAATGFSGVRRDVSTALFVLMAMVGLVLLIACANVANLLIARAFMRQKDLAVRLSLGASRGRLLRQLLVESAVLAVLGAAVGLVIAVLLGQALLSMLPQGSVPLQIRATPDGRVLLFAVAVTVGTALFFGLVPAVRASRSDPWTTLKNTIGSIAGGRGSLLMRKGLVIAQVALSFLLLFGAGLFVRSLHNLKSTSTGVAMDNLVSFQLSASLSGYDVTRGTQFYEALLEGLRSGPGVKAAAYASVPILTGNAWDSTLSVEGHTAEDGEDMQGYMNQVSPGYFATLGIPFLEGRDFTPADARDRARVAIVNHRFAEHYFKGLSAVGRRIGRGDGPGTALDIEIIGVVGDALYEGPRDGVRRQVYQPRWGKIDATYYVRTATTSADAFATIRSTIRQLDPAIPVYAMKTVSGQLDETLLTDRLIALLSAGFGVLATLLACVGLYGVMAFVVARRRKELGVRLALGAQPSGVIWLVMKEVLILLTVGLAIGIPAALVAGRYIASELHGMQGSDPVIAVSTVTLLGIVAAAAGLIPAHRASRIDPIAALRAE